MKIIAGIIVYLHLIFPFHFLIFINTKPCTMKKLLLSCFIVFSLFANAQPSSWSIRGVGGGGALFRPSINPGNPNEFYVPTDMGSMFHTTDMGKTYTEFNFLTLNGGSLAVVRFTNNSSILYAVGGTPADRSTSVNKTTDGGVTWSKVPCIASSSDPNVTETVVSLYTDYNNPNRFVFATHDGMYFSGDGGATLLDITQSSPLYQYISGTLFDGNNIYLGTPGGVVVSTDGGATFSKAALTGLTPGYDIVGFAAAKQGTTVRFFCSTMPTGVPVDQIYGSAGGYQNTYINNIYSVDYNASTVWVPKSNGVILPTSTGCYPCHYIVWLGMANNDINTVYAGGANGNAQAAVLRTTDGGDNWTDAFQIIGNVNINTGYAGYHGDLWQWYNGLDGLEVCPNNSNYAVQTSMGFVHVTTDGGTTWNQAYVSAAETNPMNMDTPKHKSYHSAGIEVTTNWLATWADANNMIFSLTDIGCLRSTDAGASWQFPSNFTYNTMYCVVKHNSGTFYGAASNIHDLYTNGLQDAPIDNSTYSNGEIMYSTDNGYTWSTLYNFGRPVYWLALDPNDPNKMYASVVNHSQGLGGIYVTSDLNNGTAATWTKLPEPPRTEGHPAKIVPLKDGKVVCTYSCRQTDWSASPSGKFTKSAGVFLYDPSGNSWTDLTDLTSLNTVSGTYTGTMGWYCNDIYVDPNDATESTWYVGVSAGYGWTDASGNTTPNDQGALMKTTDRGLHWTKLFGESNGLAAGGGVFSCNLNPNNPNEMYVATNNSGLWMSSNINDANPTFTQIKNFPFGFPLRVLFNPYKTNEMWVTTFGNGMWVGTLDITTGIPQFTSKENLEIYPNPATNQCFVNVSGLKDKGILHVHNLLGQEIQTIAIDPQIEKYTLNTGNWPEGIYTVSLNNGEVRKLVVQK